MLFGICYIIAEYKLFLGIEIYTMQTNNSCLLPTVIRFPNFVMIVLQDRLN